MKIKCDYCASYISDTDEKCPNCGATNRYLKRVGDGVPTTIEELKKWYTDHNLPSEYVTRFFIGKDVEDARAFGIYFDETSGNYVVYKNKDTGERKIRYEGKDEKYAVNELYLKLKEEIVNQKSNSNVHVNRSSSNEFPYNPSLFIAHFIAVFVVMFICMPFNIIPGIFLFLSLNPGVFIMLPILSLIKNKNVCKIIEFWWHILSFIICFILIIVCIFFPIITHYNDAYYSHNDEMYYYYGGDWYHYNNNNWEEYSGSTDDFDYVDKNYDSDYGVSNFNESSYYNDYSWGSDSSGSSDWDSGSSWDSSDSWDSGSSDWGSDW